MGLAYTSLFLQAFNVFNTLASCSLQSLVSHFISLRKMQRIEKQKNYLAVCLDFQTSVSVFSCFTSNNQLSKKTVSHKANVFLKVSYRFSPRRPHSKRNGQTHYCLFMYLHMRTHWLKLYLCWLPFREIYLTPFSCVSVQAFSPLFLKGKGKHTSQHGKAQSLTSQVCRRFRRSNSEEGDPKRRKFPPKHTMARKRLTSVVFCFSGQYSVQHCSLNCMSLIHLSVLSR